MSLSFLMARSHNSSGRMGCLTAAADALRGLAAVLRGIAVHGESVGVGNGARGDGRDGDQGGEDDGLHGRAPCCIAVSQWGRGDECFRSRYALLPKRAEISSTFGFDSVTL